mgnify:CR=1 FL=1
MKLSSSKIFSNKNLINFLYLVTFALSIGYLVNKEYVALICLLVLAGLIYFISKKIIYALGISIIVTNLLLSSGYLKTLENFKENNATTKKVATIISDIADEVKENNNNTDGSGNNVED